MPLDEVLPGYRYNKSAARYISNKTGRFVARSSILSLLDGEVLQREMEVGRLTQAFMSGQISPSVFTARFRAELLQAHLQFGALGAGGWDRLTQADYGRMGGILQADYRRINGFAQDIISGKISEAQALNRAGMYMGNARREYWHTYRGNYPIPKPGYTIIERRVLGTAEHCPSCLDYAGQGWQPHGVLPIPGENSQCMTNCRCGLESKTVLIGEMQNAKSA